VSVGGYRVAIELRTTSRVSKNLAEVIFDLSPEKRDYLITEAVKRRTAQLDLDYQTRVASLDDRVEAKALNLVQYRARQTGAVSGGFWGTLIGLIFLNPLLGMAAGATAGAISGALTDVGINDQFMKD